MRNWDRKRLALGAAEAFLILGSKAWPGAEARDLMLAGFPAGSVTYGRRFRFVLRPAPSSVAFTPLAVYPC